MDKYNKVLLTKLPDYEFTFGNHDFDNSSLLYFQQDSINLFWKWFEENNLIPLGFCRTPQFKAGKGVGFMFEDEKTFEKIWFHVSEVSYCSVVRCLFGEKELAKIWL